jgi:hypothetical protein
MGPGRAGGPGPRGDGGARAGEAGRGEDGGGRSHGRGARGAEGVLLPRGWCRGAAEAGCRKSEAGSGAREGAGPLVEGAVLWQWGCAEFGPWWIVLVDGWGGMGWDEWRNVLYAC